MKKNFYLLFVLLLCPIIVHAGECNDQVKEMIGDGNITLTNISKFDDPNYNRSVIYNYLDIECYRTPELKEGFSVENIEEDGTATVVFSNYTEYCNEYGCYYEDENPERVPIHITYDDTYTKYFNDTFPNGKISISSYEPKDYYDRVNIINAYISQFTPKGYDTRVEAFNEEDNENFIITVREKNDYGGKIVEAHEVKVELKELKNKNIQEIDSLMKKIKKGKEVYNEEYGYDTFEFNNYVIEDMDLIKFYTSGFETQTNSFLTEDNINNVLSYSSDYRRDVDSANFTFTTAAIRILDGDASYVYAVADLAVLYKNEVYGMLNNAGVEVDNVLYVPKDTEQTPEAYMAAAQERINQYTKGTKYEGKVNLEYGGPIQKHPQYNIYYNEEIGIWLSCSDFQIQFKEAFENMLMHYYILNIEGQELPAYVIISSLEERMKDAKFESKDIDTDILISSDNNTIPLYSIAEIEELDSTTYVKLLALKDGVTYDMSVYSPLTEQYYSNLGDDFYTVEVPLSEELLGKKLKAYYIKEDGTKEEYDVEVVDGKAIFKTNHFSTYTLGYVEEETSSEEEPVPLNNEVSAKEDNKTTKKDSDNPDTGDNITIYAILAITSLIGAISVGICLKKIA